MESKSELLEKWEEAYKKGLLTFWLLLLLHERPAYSYEMTESLREISQETMSADEKSIYRALSRFETMGMVRSEMQDSSIGPPRRYYSLTKMGTQLLAEFVRRNILIFEKPKVAERIRTVLDGAKEAHEHDGIS